MDLLTVGEAASILRVSPITIRRYIASGRLRCVRLGRLVRIRREELDEALGEASVPTSRRKSRPIRADDPLWTIVGMFASEDGVTDVSTNKQRYLAEATLSRSHTEEEVREIMKEIDERERR